MRGLLVIAVCAALAPAAAASDPSLAREIDALRGQLALRPGDVDLRLRLALRLTWAGELDAARAEALAVIRAAPAYWDAHVLVARIDAWSGRHAEARARLAEVLAAIPGDRNARLLAADVEIWAGRPDAARALLAPLAADDPEALYRRAVAAQLAGAPWTVHRLARELLAVNPGDPRADRLRQDTLRVRADGGLEVEFFSAARPPDRVAHGEIAGASVYLNHHVSVGAGYEYRRRFSTDNHRAWLRADWRPTRALSLMAFLRAGAVEVVPAVTAIGQAEWTRSPRLLFRARYLHDWMPWPARLHRVQVMVGVGLGGPLHAEIEGTAGLLRYCDERDLVGAARAGLAWRRPRWELRAGYGHGVELDRPALPAFLEGALGDDLCDPSIPGIEPLRASDVRAHQLDASLRWSIRPKLTVSLGIGSQLRVNGGAAHLAALGAMLAW